MKKQITFLMIVAMTIVPPLIFIGGCSAAGESVIKTGYDFSQLDKIAVVDIQGDMPELAKNQISDFFSMELMRKGYDPVERAQVQSVLKEQQFQQEGIWTNPETAAQAGKILNVPAVLVANVKFGEYLSMTAKLMDVQGASMLWIGSGSGSTGKGLMSVLAATGGAVGGGAVAGKDRTSKTAGAVAGGVSGWVIGEALTPQAEEQAQKVIKKMCETLPYRFPHLAPVKR